MQHVTEFLVQYAPWIKLYAGLSVCGTAFALALLAGGSSHE